SGNRVTLRKTCPGRMVHGGEPRPKSVPALSFPDSHTRTQERKQRASLQSPVSSLFLHISLEENAFTSLPYNNTDHSMSLGETICLIWKEKLHSSPAGMQVQICMTTKPTFMDT
ncbi:hypothetical protein DBR06_SOUSAS75510001, partial [Sousa chinensis]